MQGDQLVTVQSQNGTPIPRNLYLRSGLFDVPGLDIHALTASIGAEGHVIEHATEIEALADRLRAPTRPIVLDVRIDRDEKLPKRDRIGALDQLDLAVAEVEARPLRKENGATAQVSFDWP